MNFFVRYIKRILFRRTVTRDESINVVDGMVKAQRLYKKLCLAAHPDRHPDKKEIAEDLTMRLVSSKHDYATLLKLEAKIKEKLI